MAKTQAPVRRMKAEPMETDVPQTRCAPFLPEDEKVPPDCYHKNNQHFRPPQIGPPAPSFPPSSRPHPPSPPVAAVSGHDSTNGPALPSTPKPPARAYVRPSDSPRSYNARLSPASYNTSSPTSLGMQPRATPPFLGPYRAAGKGRTPPLSGKGPTPPLSTETLSEHEHATAEPRASLHHDLPSHASLALRPDGEGPLVAQCRQPLGSPDCPITGPKIFVGNIPPSVQHQQMVDVFENCGSVKDVVLLPPTSQLRSDLRAAFVIYNDTAAAVRAWTELRNTTPFAADHSSSSAGHSLSTPARQPVSAAHTAIKPYTHPPLPSYHEAAAAPSSRGPATIKVEQSDPEMSSDPPPQDTPRSAYSVAKVPSAVPGRNTGCVPRALSDKWAVCTNVDSRPRFPPPPDHPPPKYVAQHGAWAQGADRKCGGKEGKGERGEDVRQDEDDTDQHKDGDTGMLIDKHEGSGKGKGKGRDTGKRKRSPDVNNQSAAVHQKLQQLREEQERERKYQQREWELQQKTEELERREREQKKQQEKLDRDKRLLRQQKQEEERQREKREQKQKQERQQRDQERQKRQKQKLEDEKRQREHAAQQRAERRREEDRQRFEQEKRDREHRERDRQWVPPQGWAPQAPPEDDAWSWAPKPPPPPPPSPSPSFAGPRPSEEPCAAQDQPEIFIKHDGRLATPSPMYYRYGPDRGPPPPFQSPASFSAHAPARDDLLMLPPPQRFTPSLEMPPPPPRFPPPQPSSEPKAPRLMTFPNEASVPSMPPPILKYAAPPNGHLPSDEPQKAAPVMTTWANEPSLPPASSSGREPATSAAGVSKREHSSASPMTSPADSATHAAQVTHATQATYATSPAIATMQRVLGSRFTSVYEQIGEDGIICMHRDGWTDAKMLSDAVREESKEFENFVAKGLKLQPGGKLYSLKKLLRELAVNQ